MNTENSTGNPARLPLAERARLGLLPGEPEMLVAELPFLEHPADQAARKQLGAAIRTAIQYGDLEPIERQREMQQRRPFPTRYILDGWRNSNPFTRRTETTTVTVTEIFVSRESYRAWRAQCPKELLSPLPLSSPLSQVAKWLGVMPPAESDKPLTEQQADKRDCQNIARQLWTENPQATQADLLKNPRIKPYKNKWPGKNTLPDWLREVDPRPKSARKGRPRKSA